MTTLVTGDTTIISMTLKKNEATFNIDEAAEVKVTIVNSRHELLVTGEPVAQVHDTPGADWANSLVSIVIPGSFTEEITAYGSALIELQIDDDGVQDTWFSSIKIVKGNIS